MAANFLHGVETINIDKGPRPVRLVKTAVIGLIGTAAAGAVNTPILVASDKDFAQFGENIANSSILSALDAVYDQKGTVCIVINVCDPAVHKTTITTENTTVALDGTFALPHGAVSAVTIKSSAATPVTYTLGTDYTIDLATGKGKRLSTGNIPASTAATATVLKADYTYVDPTLVSATDIIGGIVAATGARTGMKAFKDSYQMFGFYPKVLIAPQFASLNSVSAELLVQANALRAIAFLDAPAGITPSAAITGRGPLGTINFNTSNRRAVLCYPHVKVYDPRTNSEVLQAPSARLAGALTHRDQEDGYWWSLSNLEIQGITGLERMITAELSDPNCEANLLNEVGITTFFNSFGTGIRSWGNRSAAWPTDTHPKNFVNVQRVSDIIAESLELNTLQYNDRPLDNPLIDSIVESGNTFMRKLKGDGAIIDGRVWFEPSRNSATELAAGHAIYSYDFMPPTPMERVTYEASVNTGYLASLGRSN